MSGCGPDKGCEYDGFCNLGLISVEVPKLRSIADLAVIEGNSPSLRLLILYGSHTIVRPQRKIAHSIMWLRLKVVIIEREYWTYQG